MVYLMQLRRGRVVRKQIEGPGDDVGPCPPSVIVHRRLAFLKYLDSRKSPNLLKKKIKLTCKMKSGNLDGF